jgi:hypothetical protein
MYMPVQYTPPAPTWPPKTKTTPGMSAYEQQNFVIPQRLIDALNSAQIQVPQGWGMGGYVSQNSRSRMMTFYPPPYGFASGMGHCCESCASGGSCSGHDHHGMGQLFESTDISQWGMGEWAVIGLGGLGAIYALSLLGKGASGVRSYGRKRASRARKRAALQSELAGL